MYVCYAGVKELGNYILDFASNTCPLFGVHKIGTNYPLPFILEGQVQRNPGGICPGKTILHIVCIADC